MIGEQIGLEKKVKEGKKRKGKEMKGEVTQDKVG